MDDYEDIEGFAKRDRRRRKILAVVALGIFAIPLVWVGYSYYKRQQRFDQLHEQNRKALELSPEDIASLKQRIAETKARIATQHETWKRAVTPDELAKLQPSSAPCNLPRLDGADYAQRDSIGGGYFRASYGMVAVGETPGLPYASVLADVERVEAKLADGTATQNDVTRFELPNLITFIVVEKETKPVVHTSSFVPGALLGRAYVYAASAQRIACVGDISAANSEVLQIDFTYMAGNYADKQFKARQAAEWKLAGDLDAQITKAIATSLRAVN